MIFLFYNLFVCSLITKQVTGCKLNAFCRMEDICRFIMIIRVVDNGSFIENLTTKRSSWTLLSTFFYSILWKKIVIWTAFVPRFPLNTKRENRKFGSRSKFSLGLDFTQSFKISYSFSSAWQYVFSEFKIYLANWYYHRITFAILVVHFLVLSSFYVNSPENLHSSRRGS